MNLTLEIISANGQSLGAARRKVFGPEGGRIGRAPDCEWVLANPYVSRHHATIRWISGTYYIESMGENGVALNTPQAMIPMRERRALKNGDRLFVDEYDITVTIDSGLGESAAPLTMAAGTRGFAPIADPLGDLAATARSPILSDPLGLSHDDLDPLKHLTGGSPGRGTPAARPEEKWNHTPGVLDQFTPPAIPGVSPSASAGVIPDDWDKTSFGRPGSAAPGAPRPATPISGASVSNSQVSDPLMPADSSGTGASGFVPIPDDWDKTSFSRSASSTAPARQPASPPSAPVTGMTDAPPVSRTRGEPLPLRPARIDPALMQSTSPQPQKSRQTPASPEQQTSAPAPAAPGPSTLVPQGPSAHTPSQQSAGATGTLDLTDFLRAAGVDPATVPPETATSLGLILRAVVQGVVEVLQARAEVKNQFRVPLTRIKTAENNPLKFAVNAEDALNSLLGRRNSAYLAPVEAFEDAFDDIRFHQMAMLAGMRAGFEHALKRFDPDRLREMFDKRVKRGGLLQMSTKSRYWELYADEFRELTADPDEAFKRLFGEVFGSAYEQQLEELKRNRRKPPR